MKNDIATFIESERKKQEISIAELHRRSGVPYSTLSQIEKGTVVPQIVTTEKIIDALGYRLVLMKKNVEIFKN